MKKAIVYAVALVSLFNIGCGGTEGAPAAVGDEARLLEEVASNERFQQVRDQLARHGDELDMAQAGLQSVENGFAAIIPVKGEKSEYSSVVYQQLGGQEPSVSLELSGRASSSAPEHSALYQCGSWGSWSTIGSYCAWHIMCLGDATMWDRQRCRTCWTSTGQFTDCEYTTVRHKCGC